MRTRGEDAVQRELELRSQAVGPYRVENLVGAGGMGQVFRGFDDRLDRPVALKRLLPGTSQSPTRRSRFRREARAIARLRHPHIVQVYDFLEIDDDRWIVMEWVEGSSLREILRQGPIDPSRAQDIARQIAEALVAAHAADLIHRDLKAENVMLTTDDEVRVLDFGLAKLTRDSEEQASWSWRSATGPQADGSETEHSISTVGQVLGTVGSMSPEQALGQTLDPRSDLFSLGCLVYEMICGQAPFRGDNEVDTLQRICSHQPPPLASVVDGLPVGLSELTEALLEKDRARRPADAQTVAEALRPDSDPEVLVWGTADSDSDLGATWIDSTAEEDGRLEAVDAAPQAQAATQLKPQDPPSPSEARPSDRRRRSLSLAVGLVLAFAFVVLFGRSQAEPRRIAVLQTSVTLNELGAEAEALQDTLFQDEEALAQAAKAVHAGVLQSLLQLRDVTVIEAPRDADQLVEPGSVRRALGADELVRSHLSCFARTCQIELRRFDAADGNLLWSQLYSTNSLNLLALSTQSGEQIRAGFPDLEPTTDAARLEVTSEDYASYFGLIAALDRRALDPPLLIDQLALLLQRAPRFLPGWLLQARVAIVHFVETRDEETLARGRKALDQASSLAPDDPRVLREQIRWGLELDEIDSARRLVERLERQDPGDPALVFYRAEILAKQGHVQRAIESLEKIPQPSALKYSYAADFAYHAGDFAQALKALERSLELWPNRFFTLSRLAQLELMQGDPERAAELYRALEARYPALVERTYLALAYRLLERYDEAAEHLRQAMDEVSESPQALVVLAELETLRGNPAAGEALFLRVLDEIDEDPAPAPLVSIRAQALAHLGRSQEAVADIHEALRRWPDHPQVLYEASMVFVLVGDHTSALWHARRALDAGIARRWFDGPWFEPLAQSLDADPTVTP